MNVDPGFIMMIQERMQKLATVAKFLEIMAHRNLTEYEALLYEALCTNLTTEFRAFTENLSDTDTKDDNSSPEGES